MWLHLLIFPLLTISSISSTPLLKGVCGDFIEGACELSETNIVAIDRYTNSPGECQTMCKNEPECSWFTHFSTQCYLLVECGQSAHCDGCASGPTSPDFGPCPWPPGPTNSPTEPTTASTSTTTTTTTTKSTSKPTPTPKPTLPPTTPTTTTTDNQQG